MENHQGAIVSNPTKTIVNKYIADAFIDDTTGYCMIPDSPSISNFKDQQKQRITRVKQLTESYTTDYAETLNSNAHPLNNEKEYAWMVEYD